MDVNEFLHKVANGRLNFGKQDLSNFKLQGQNLRGISLGGANLRGADLSHVDLRRTDLREADLREANLSKANLCKARLHGAKLQNADLAGADLSLAILYRANLHSANLKNAKLQTTFLIEANLTNADLSNAFLVGADLSSATLTRANMTSADISGAELYAATMTATKIKDIETRSKTSIDLESYEEIACNHGIRFNSSWQLYIWERMRYRSKSEIEIAKALDQVGVLFIPNSLARLNSPEGRRNLEPDFLVCHQGRWGILEVDGPWHTVSRRVDEQERERLFRFHGIRVIERFDSKRCENHPELVVQEFLQMLERMY